MNTEQIKKEAEEMVSKFRMYAERHAQDGNYWETHFDEQVLIRNAKQCAIIHCELVIERFGYIFTSDEDYNAEADHYQKVIEYIKQM